MGNALDILNSLSPDSDLEKNEEGQFVRPDCKRRSRSCLVGVPAVSKHIANIIDVDELDANPTISKMEQVQFEDSCQIKRTVNVYNLDMILRERSRIQSSHLSMSLVALC